MLLSEKRKVMTPDRYGQRHLQFVVGDPVRVRVGATHAFRHAKIIAIADETMSISYEGTIDTVIVPLASVKQPGADGEFANGLSGLGGCSRSGSRPRKRSKAASKTDELHFWAVDKITRLIVKENVGGITSVASRITSVASSSLLSWRCRGRRPVTHICSVMTHDAYL
jgi:hypothetical protein